MDFNPDTWGTVADWVGSIGTTLAFVATFVVILRDAMVRRRIQARKVAFHGEVTTWEEATDGKPEVLDNDVSFVNLSDEPIYKVFMYDNNRNVWPEMWWLPSEEIVLPGAKVTWSARGPKADVHVTFADNSGQGWLRTTRGDLHPISRRGRVSREAKKIMDGVR